LTIGIRAPHLRWRAANYGGLMTKDNNPLYLLRDLLCVALRSAAPPAFIARHAAPRTPLLRATRLPAAAPAVLLPGLLTASMASTDWRTPGPRATDRYPTAPLPDQTASAQGASGVPQHFASGEDIPAAWWSLYRCEPLDTLVRKALANSPNI